MPVRLDSGDLGKIARNLGEAGRPMPDWVRADPALISAYDQGTGDGNRGAMFHPPPAPRRRAPTPASRPRPASEPSTRNRKPTSSASRKSGYLDRSFSPSAAVGRTPLSGLSAAGDGGGLMLAFVLYPIALASLKYGAAGPGKWFRAKWLNETDKAPNNLGPVSATLPTNPGANDTAHPGYHNPGLPSSVPHTGQPRTFPNGHPIPGQNGPAPAPGQPGGEPVPA